MRRGFAWGSGAVASVLIGIVGITVHLISYPPQALLPIPVPVSRDPSSIDNREAFWSTHFARARTFIEAVGPTKYGRSTVGAEFQVHDVRIARPKDDHAHLAAWHVVGTFRGSESLRKGRGETVFITVHGVGGARVEFYRSAPFLLEFGDLLMIDTRECGLSSGSGAGVSFGYREKADVLAAVVYAREVLSAKRVVVVGASAGAAAAIMAAEWSVRRARGPLEEIDAVLALAPPASLALGIEDMAQSLARALLGSTSTWMIGPGALLFPVLSLVATAAEFVVSASGALAIGEAPTDAVSPIAAAETLIRARDNVGGEEIPHPRVLIVHGMSDRIVPQRHPKVFEDAGVDVCRVPGVGHNNNDLLLAKECRAEIIDILVG